jgi:hypothetical protein
VLQWLAEIAKRVHAFVNGLAPEHVDAELQPAFIEVLVVHGSLPPVTFTRLPLARLFV